MSTIITGDPSADKIFEDLQKFPTLYKGISQTIHDPNIPDNQKIIDLSFFATKKLQIIKSIKKSFGDQKSLVNKYFPNKFTLSPKVDTHIKSLEATIKACSLVLKQEPSKEI